VTETGAWTAAGFVVEGAETDAGTATDSGAGFVSTDTTEAVRIRLEAGAFDSN